jgi:hypothetical protein
MPRVYRRDLDLTSALWMLSHIHKALIEYAYLVYFANSGSSSLVGVAKALGCNGAG